MSYLRFQTLDIRVMESVFAVLKRAHEVGVQHIARLQRASRAALTSHRTQRIETSLHVLKFE